MNIAFRGIKEVGAAVSSVAKNEDVSNCCYRLSFLVDDSGRYNDYSALKENGLFDKFPSNSYSDYVVLETKFKRASGVDLNPNFFINGKKVESENISIFRQLMNILNRELLKCDIHPECTKKFMMHKEGISGLFSGFHQKLPSYPKDKALIAYHYQDDFVKTIFRQMLGKSKTAARELKRSLRF